VPAGRCQPVAAGRKPRRELVHRRRCRRLRGVLSDVKCLILCLAGGHQAPAVSYKKDRKGGGRHRAAMLDRGLHQRYRIGVATLFGIERSQVAERVRDIGMVGTERLLIDRQRSFEQRLGVGIATLARVKRSQAVERSRDIGIVGTERFLPDRQRSLVERLGERRLVVVRVVSSAASRPADPRLAPPSSRRADRGRRRSAAATRACD
jgi:hypothetical protein